MKITKKLLMEKIIITEDQYDGIQDFWLKLKEDDKFYELDKLDSGQLYFRVWSTDQVALYGIKSGFRYMYCSKGGVDAFKTAENWAKQSGFKIVEKPANPPDEQIKDPYNHPFKSE
jgi:hypothetical protein